MVEHPSACVARAIALQGGWRPASPWATSSPASDWPGCSSSRRTAAAPAEIVKAWMNSPGHRAIILPAAFREVGVGIAGGAPQGGNGATYVLDVGRRK